MPDELNLVIQVLMDLMERVKFLERGIVKTPRPIQNDSPLLLETPSTPQPIGSVKRHVTRSDQEKMAELFRAGLSIPNIGRQTGWTTETVYSQLAKAGILHRNKRKSPIS
jgi:hypothetical protein